MVKKKKISKFSKNVTRTNPSLKPLFTPSLRLSQFSLAYSFSILCALFIFILSLTAKSTAYGQDAVKIIQPFFFTFTSLSAFSIISAMAEAAIHGLIIGFLVAWLYNKLS